MTTNTTTRPSVALIYDFDGTLSPKNMQEFGFIQAIGRGVDEFWAKSATMSKENDASGILCYMYNMLQAAQSNNISLRRESFQRFGSLVELYPGVKEWFAMINEYGKSQGLNVQHYINSSGLKEMIEGTSIAHEFENIYACSFLYNIDGVAYWPAVAVDYTTKTQFLFKINKGIREVSDNKRINDFTPIEKRPVPFSRMIYFGDGETDIPCMKLVKSLGGHSIAVYGDDNKAPLAQRLIDESRVHFACKANYSRDSQLASIVMRIIDKIKCDIDLSSVPSPIHRNL